MEAGRRRMLCCSISPVLPCFSSRLHLHLHLHLHLPFLHIRCCSAVSPSDLSRPRVLVISGPTAVGKSSAALEVAKRINGEIISADSVQVYQGLDVGSAKTSLEDRQGVHHHLIDIVHPKEEYSVGKYYRKSKEATELILDKGNVPIVVGGTGLYLRWYLYGPGDAPKSTPEIRTSAEDEVLKAGGDWDKAVKMLSDAGDMHVTKILQNDWYRISRRFEILKASKLPGSQLNLQSTENGSQNTASQIREEEDCGISIRQSPNVQDLEYDFLCFFLYNPRETLYRFIDLRCEEMLTGEIGLLKEASWLLDLGLMPNTSSVTRAIGYRQAMEYLLECRKDDGVSSPEQFLSFIERFQIASRNFAKRQLTWFRQESLYHWIDASQNQDVIVDFIVKAYFEPSTITTAAADGILLQKETTTDKKNHLRVYRPMNRHFCRAEDCHQALEWIRKTQRSPKMDI